MSQTKTMAASDVKNSFGSVMSLVQAGKYRELVVENRGEPIAVIIDMKTFESVKAFIKQENQRKALEQMRKIRADVQAKLKRKLSDKEVDTLANRLSHDLVENLEKKGKVTFEKSD